MSIQFRVTPDKASPATRYDRGIKITAQAPTSPLYQQHQDFQGAADEVIKDTLALKAAMDDQTKAEATALAARTALASMLVKWDGSYDVFTKTGQKYVLTPNDAASVGGEPLVRVNNPIAMPLSVVFTWNYLKDHLRVHVKRAPGMQVVGVQLSPTPITPESWFDLEGNGAIHLYPHPAKGTWWARARSCATKGKSDFTVPVSVIVT